jgi:TMEM175 potassium channel family protein
MIGNMAGLSKHRVEGLTDGIYAVAMTLLVLELKLPDTAQLSTEEDLQRMLLQLLPKAIAWIISFFILAIFWLSHQRAFHFVRRVDTKLLWINVLALMFASLLPFSSALVGEHSFLFTAQVVYAMHMAALALMGIWQLRHLRAHPELCEANGFPANVARGARFRCWSLVAVAALAVAIASFAPRLATMAFLLMILLGRIGRRMEANPEPTP